MKKFYFLTLALICAFVANALDTKNSHVYFNGTGWENYQEEGVTKPISTIQLMFGKNNGSAGCEMEKINNTNLYYLYTPEWNGYTEFCILGADALWGWEDGSNFPLKDRKNWGRKSSAILQDYPLKTGESNLLEEEGTSLKGNKLTNGYSALNHTQTVNVDGVGSVTVSSVKLSSASGTTTTLNSATVDTKNETSTASTSIDAAYTATVTCEATPGEGESFVGWFEGEILLTTDETYSYVAANAPKTIKAEFSKTTAIEEVGVDAGEAVYYNLQGVKVANPENGIFIKKQGNKTTKVVL